MVEALSVVDAGAVAPELWSAAFADEMPTAGGTT